MEQKTSAKIKASATSGDDREQRPAAASEVTCSLRALKGHLTRVIRTINKAIQCETNHGPSKFVMRTLNKGTDSIDALISDIEDTFLTLCRIDPDKTDEYLVEVDKETNRAKNTARMAAWGALQRCIATQHHVPSRAANDQILVTNPAPGNQIHATMVLKPFI